MLPEYTETRVRYKKVRHMYAVIIALFKQLCLIFYEQTKKDLERQSTKIVFAHIFYSIHTKSSNNITEDIPIATMLQYAGGHRFNGCLWVENLIPGGRVPHTMYCLSVEHLRRAVVSDRHWYERSNRPHAFTFGKCTIY